MHVKLTESFYIEPKCIDIVELSERFGEPWVEVWTKRQDLSELHFRGDDLGGHLKTGQSGSPQNRPVERV